MSQAQSKIEKSIELYKKLKKSSWQDSEIVGELELDHNVYELINALDAESLIYPNVVIDSKTYTLQELSIEKHKGMNLKVRLQPPRNPIGEVYFAKDLDDLLSIKKFKLTEPKIYYLASEDYYNLKSEPNSATKEYLSVIKLISIIQKISDHIELNGDKSKSIILVKGKLVIPINYCKNDLRSFEKIEELSLDLLAAPQIENKIEILRSTLFESLANIPEEERFHYLLRTFDFIYQKYRDNFNLFLSEFSFDKIKEEVIERKVEYIHKLNKVVSDIQNKILAIPIALLLISTQMSQSENDYLKNFIILLGSYVFLLLMHFLVNNQLNTLEVIKGSIEHSKDTLLNKYASLSTKFEGVFDELLIRYRRQKTILSIIWFMALLSFLICLVLFLIFMKNIFAYI